MAAAEPGTVHLSTTAPNGSTVTATAAYDPDTHALGDPFLTAGDANTHQLTVTITLGDGPAVHTRNLAPGETLAAADLAALGVTQWDQVHSISLTAA